MVPSETRKSYYTSTEMLLRALLFVAHAVSAVVMLLKAFGTLDGVGCDGVVYSSSQQVRMTDPVVVETNPALYRLKITRYRNSTECNSTWEPKSAWCNAQNLPDLFDIESGENSHTFGSSWNTIATIMIFEWITASYALFYIDPFDSWLSSESIWWGMHPIPAACTVWNGAMFIAVWGARQYLNIPPNNVVIFSFCLLFTMGMQNFLSISREPQPDSDMEPLIEINTEPVKPAVSWRTDHFLRNRKKMDSVYEWKQTPLDMNFHEPAYNQLLEKKGYGIIPRYLEYAVTAPLLLVALFSNSVPFDLTWKFQAVFMALFVCNMAGVSLHFAITSLADENGRYYRIASYLFCAAWLSLCSGLYVFVWSCREFMLKSTDMPQWVLVLIWLVIVMYSAFGVIASRFYLPRLIYSGPFPADDWAWMGTYLDYASLFIKLPVAWTIWVKGAIVLCEKATVC